MNNGGVFICGVATEICPAASGSRPLDDAEASTCRCICKVCIWEECEMAVIQVRHPDGMVGWVFV